MDVAAYTEQLIALLPTGPCWNVEPGTVLRSLIEGLAEELARIDGRVRDLQNEWDPRTMLETLPDWERVYGLPDGCTGAGSAIAQRRSAVIARVVARGGQTPVYYINLASAMGFTITITEFRPYTVASPCNAPVCGTAWAYAWQVNAPLNTIGRFNVTTPVSEPLAWWGNAVLECVIRRLKPAHTHVQFSYS